MGRWAFEQLEPWLRIRSRLPIGPLFCVLRGPTRGRPCSPGGILSQLRNTALAAGVRHPRSWPETSAEPSGSDSAATLRPRAARRLDRPAEQPSARRGETAEAIDKAEAERELG
jgi:hypothetical protein